MSPLLMYILEEKRRSSKKARTQIKDPVVASPEVLSAGWCTINSGNEIFNYEMSKSFEEPLKPVYF
jgi:hypothetical protein